MQQPDQRPANDIAWVESLRGHYGIELQRQSHEALAKYLYKVGYNYLLIRRNDVAVFATFAEEDLAALAEEFVQDFLYKLAANDFALLTKYQGTGSFTSFAAVVLRRMIAKELLKKSWTTREARSRHDNEDDRWGQDSSLETLADRIHLTTALDHCLQTLSERDRMLILRILVDGDGAPLLAQELDTTANAISIALFRAKNKLRKCLDEQGIIPY